MSSQTSGPFSRAGGAVWATAAPPAITAALASKLRRVRSAIAPSGWDYLSFICSSTALPSRLSGLASISGISKWL